MTRCTQQQQQQQQHAELLLRSSGVLRRLLSRNLKKARRYACYLRFTFAFDMFSRPMSEVYFGDVCTPVHTVAARSRLYDQRTTETPSFHVCGRPDLAAAASACVVRQSGTNFHGICEAQTPRNSLSLALSAGYLLSLIHI